MLELSVSPRDTREVGAVRDWLERLERHAPAAARAAAYTASLLVAAPILYHLAHDSGAYLGLFEDDYFYYATIADNFVAHGTLTYDGTSVTNGFHPLWFIAIAALRAVHGGFTEAFYLSLTLIALAAMLASYELGRRFASSIGTSPPVAAAAAAAYAVGTGRLLTTGMECVLAIPLFLWLLAEIAGTRHLNPRRAFRLGLIASLAVLARLDIAIAIALLIVGYVAVARPSRATLGRVAVAFSAGATPLAVYLVANVAYFGSPFPMSMLAKSVATSVGFNLSYARIVALGTVYGPTIGIVLPLGLIAFIRLFIRRGHGDAASGRFAGALALVFAFGFFGINAVSGWTFFGWYAYPLTAATIAAVVFICEQWSSPALRRAVQTVAVSAVVVMTPVAAARYYVDHGPGWSVADNTLLAMSHELARRMETREGLVAMGAVAGVAGYVMERPVRQLEGIVGDLAMIDYLRQRTPLETVLRATGSDYLVVSLVNVRSEWQEGCYLVTQPHPEWAGEGAVRLRGEICSRPIEHFFTPRSPNRQSRFPTTETLVWDLRNAVWKRDSREVSAEVR